MLYRSILVSGAGFVKIMDLLAREGSIFDDFAHLLGLVSASVKE